MIDMNISHVQEQFDQAAREARGLHQRITTQAESERRALTASEQATITAALRKAQSLKERLNDAHGDSNMLAEIERLTSGNGTRPSSRGGASLGAQFINSETFRWLKETKNSRAGTWSSPASELGIPTLEATTLSEGAGSGGALIVPDVQPGIVQLPTRPLVMSDLIAPGTTGSNAVQYMRETTFTNAAATTAEGATKQESTLVFDAVTEPVRKIAHWLPVTEEMLEDYAALSSYIDARLRTGVQLKEDDQLLNGSVVPPDLVGFLNRAGLAAAQPRGADTNADAIMKQIAAIQTATNLPVEGIVINPTNWLTIQLTKNAAGNYLGNGPWAPAQPATLWGIPVAVTSAIVVNTALVGAFRSAAQLFRRGGLRVEASNSHQDFFIKKPRGDSC
jgi:HK97 family phage major capsid protein